MAKQKGSAVGDYPVGYRRPPTSSQFKPGQSGNPKGRPKGALNLATVLDRAVHERVTVVEHGKQKQITKLEAAAKQLANKAASGDYRALALLLPQLTVIDATLSAGTAPATDANDQAVMTTLMQRFSLPDATGSGANPPRAPRTFRLPKKPPIKS